MPFDDGAITHILSYDEKPGIQAIANTSDDLMLVETSGVTKRDYEYKRLGTVSLLAGIDLQTGDAIPLVSDTHNSNDYITFLKMLNDNASWLNLVEGFFSKMTKQVLQGIRVAPNEDGKVQTLIS